MPSPSSRRHSREGGNPGATAPSLAWTPACAGVTKEKFTCRTLPTLAHDHRRRGGRVGPAEIGADLHVFDLAAAAFLVVEIVLSLAVWPHRAGIVDIVAQLAGILDHHVHAVGVALAEMTARSVIGPLAAEGDRAVRYIMP